MSTTLHESIVGGAPWTCQCLWTGLQTSCLEQTKWLRLWTKVCLMTILTIGSIGDTFSFTSELVVSMCSLLSHPRLGLHQGRAECRLFLRPIAAFKSKKVLDNHLLLQFGSHQSPFLQVDTTSENAEVQMTQIKKCGAPSRPNEVINEPPCVSLSTYLLCDHQ